MKEIFNKQSTTQPHQIHGPPFLFVSAHLVISDYLFINDDESLYSDSFVFEI